MFTLATIIVITSMKHTRLISIILTALLLTIYGEAEGSEPQSSVVPQSPDYTEATQWYVTDRGGQADLFYVTSTETADYRGADGTLFHYADTRNDSVRKAIYDEMHGVDVLLGGDFNFYSPYYRQCSMQSFATTALCQARLPLALSDVRRAFRHYIEHDNHGRPFVLAGFSQGAMIVKQLLVEMDDTTRSRMIAAYVIGAVYSDAEVANVPAVRPARNASDTGVTICYNSVRDPSCALAGWEYSAVAINPVNWCTDATPAELDTEPTPLLPVDQQAKDHLTVRLDVASGLLVVDGYTATDYVLPFIGRDGCYHSREIWLYRQQLRDNMALRAATYLKHTGR